MAFAKSVIALTVFGSNFVFWEQSGYFAPSAAEVPLLHTWSLAVEEQFYLLFPLIMYMVARFWQSRYLGVLGFLAEAKVKRKSSLHSFRR